MAGAADTTLLHHPSSASLAILEVNFANVTHEPELERSRRVGSNHTNSIPYLLMLHKISFCE